MKVIFLDVDGVLNSEKDLLEAKGKSELFDRPLALLKELVESTKSMIIPGLFEPPVRTLRATIPENESHIFR